MYYVTSVNVSWKWRITIDQTQIKINLSFNIHIKLIGYTKIVCSVITVKVLQRTSNVMVLELNQGRAKVSLREGNIQIIDFINL